MWLLPEPMNSAHALTEGVATVLSNAPIVFIKTHGFVITGMSIADCRSSLDKLLSSLGWKLP